MEDRRQFPRLRAFINADYNTMHSPEEKLESRLIDVSRYGLKMLTERPLEKGTYIELNIGLPNRFPAQAFAEVMWIARGEADLFEIGARFTKIKSYNKSHILELAYRAMKKTLNSIPA